MEKVILKALKEDNDVSVETFLEWRNSKKPKVDGLAEEDYSFLAEDDNIDCAPAAPEPAPTTNNGAESSTANGGSPAGANAA